MHCRLSLAAVLLAAATVPAAAQNLTPTSSVVTEPLRDVPASVVLAQPLSSGEVTHQVRLEVPQGQAPVTVRTIQPDTVAGNYHIDFDALDADHDGYISRGEAQANPALADEFDSLDTARSGRLSRAQLAGWL